MSLPSKYQERPAVEVAILNALIDRGNEGMTVLELRAAVDADIDAIETALPRLKADGLIMTINDGGTVRIQPADHVIPDPDPDGEADGISMIDRLREKLGF